MSPHVRTCLAVLAAALALSGQALSFPGPDPGGAETLDQVCTRYANAAVAQYQENVRLKCGYSYPVWTGDHNFHKQWCIRTNGNQANDENRKRQAALKSCLESVCVAYANSAVRQQKENTQNSCGFRGAPWDPSFNHHYQWCISGENQKRAPEEERRRAAQLARCTAPKAPLDGDFKIVRVVPRVGGGPRERFVESIDIVLETTSARPWVIGDYGHRKYGSLWAEVTVNAKVAPNGVVQDNRRTYLFSIRGTAADAQAFVAPHPGRKVPAGTRTLTLTVAPAPRIPLTGVETMFSMPGSPFGPGETGCWYTDPDVSVKVFIVTTANLATVRTGKSLPVMNATYIRVFKPPRGGFNEGVVYHRCR